MNKPKPAGNFNVGVLASLYDKNEKYIGRCLYAPVPVIEAIEENPNIAIVKAQYPGFKEKIRTAAEILETGHFSGDW